jgi:hypothetical protein
VAARNAQLPCARQSSHSNHQSSVVNSLGHSSNSNDISMGNNKRSFGVGVVIIRTICNIATNYPARTQTFS